ncbi:MAG: FecR domain-containing protein [Sphingobium sp.]
MGGRYRTSEEREAIEAEAVRLFHIAQASGRDADWETAYSWAELDPAHGVALAKAEASWDLAQRLREAPPQIGREAIAGPAGRLEASLEPLLSRRAMAAMLGLTILCAGSIIATQKMLAVDRYRTGIGEERMVRLADGSLVHLNTDSAIEVALGAEQRDINLLRGEARFDVAHDTNRPFIVTAGGSSIRAVGTSFTVRMRPELTELMVIEGKVAVRDGTMPSTMVAAGTAAAIRGGTVATTRLAPQQVAQRTAWQQGMLTFGGETLAQAVEECNRYRHVPLVIGDPQIASIRIGGTFRADGGDQFVLALEHGFGIRSIRGGDAVLLLSAQDMAEPQEEGPASANP